MTTGIYKITNIRNGRCYIGQSIDIERRWMEHRTPKNRDLNTPLYNDIRLYGIQNFKFEVLEECPAEKLNEMEQQYISKYKSTALYNRNDGGAGNYGHAVSEATRRALRYAGRKQWERKSDEEKRNVISRQLCGPRIGHEVSERTRNLLREANTGKKQTQATIVKRAAKLSVSMRGNQNRKRSVLCVNLDNLDVEIYDMVISAARAIRTNPEHLVHVLKKDRPVVKNWYVTYLRSVETIGDECNRVGSEMRTDSKCAASLVDEEIVHASEMANQKTNDKGFIQLAIRSRQFSCINVTDVRQGELRNYDLLSGEINVQAVPNRSELPVIGYVAYFRLNNGNGVSDSFSKSLYMTVDELQQHAKTYSQTYKSDKDYIRNSSKWTTDFDAMAKKTVLKLLLSRYAPLSVEMQQIQDAIRSDQAVIGESGQPAAYIDNATVSEAEEVPAEAYDDLVNEKKEQMRLNASKAPEMP